MSPRPDRPLRLWIVHQNAAPPDQGGLPRAHHLARALVRRGYQVTIVAGSFAQGTGQNRLPPEESRRAEVHGGVEVIWLRTPGHHGGVLSWVGNMLAFGWRVRGEQPAPAAVPDLVLGSTPPSLAALAAERLAARIGVPFVLEVRDLWPGTLIERGSLARWSPLRPILAWIEWFLQRRAAQIVTALPQAADTAGDGSEAGPKNCDRLADALDRSLRLALDLPGGAAEATTEPATATDQRERAPLPARRKGD